MKQEREWKSVPEELWRPWQQIFSSSQDGIDVDGLCPVCHSPTLHHWFDKARPFDEGQEKEGFRGRGGLWEWCSSCHSYEHYSGYVPDWWQDVLAVDEDLLTHDPDAIESARLESM
ncbi:MAG: hypothetical protein EOP83_00675 [Verrucomicrobiaceae bacterium]|nr:MAG: hypothetical protein EOP83_00675 [Verrucomicrobiaceae bacterium]